MNSHLHISAKFDEPEFIQTLVERLAYKRYDIGYGRQKMPVGFTALETSSAETYVTGAIVLQFDDNEERTNMPFITCFTFTCIKDKSENYKLIWSSSMN